MAIKRSKRSERQLKEMTGSRKMATAKSKKTMRDAFARMDAKKKRPGLKGGIGLRDKESDFTTPTKIGDASVRVRKSYAKKIGKEGRKKLVKETRKRAIGRAVSKALGKDPDKKANDMFKSSKKLYGDWLKPKGGKSQT